MGFSVRFVLLMLQLMTHVTEFPLALGILLPWTSLQTTLQSVPGVTGRSRAFVQPSAPFHLLLPWVVGQLCSCLCEVLPKEGKKLSILYKIFDAEGFRKISLTWSLKLFFLIPCQEV